GRKERLDIALSEKVRCAMRPVNDAQGPLIRKFGDLAMLEPRGMRRVRAGTGKLQRIAGLERPSRMTAEAAKYKGRARSQIFRHLEAAIDGKIGSLAGPLRTAHGEDLTGGNADGFIVRNRDPIQRRLHVRTNKRNYTGLIEAQGWAACRYFEG